MYVCLFPVLINRSVAAAFLSSPVFSPLHIHFLLLLYTDQIWNWSLCLFKLSRTMLDLDHTCLDDRKWCSLMYWVFLFLIFINLLILVPNMSSEKGDRIFFVYTLCFFVCLFVCFSSVIDRDWQTWMGILDLWVRFKIDSLDYSSDDVFFFAFSLIMYTNLIPTMSKLKQVFWKNIALIIKRLLKYTRSCLWFWSSQLDSDLSQCNVNIMQLIGKVQIWCWMELFDLFCSLLSEMMLEWLYSF